MIALANLGAMISLRFLILGGLALSPTAAAAQWWSPFAPRDYEDCATAVEKGPTKETKAGLLQDCDVKFPGRRKPGGGYTYFDFMQNRHFDIAGPRPTAEELRHMDEEYAAYLGRQRHNEIAAALIQEQQEAAARNVAARDLASGDVTAAMPPPPPLTRRPPPPQLKTAALSPPLTLPLARPPAAARAAKRAAKPKPEPCENRLACTWSDLSNKVKTLFAPARPAKADKGI